jgi:serine/threonine protein kinase
MTPDDKYCSSVQLKFGGSTQLSPTVASHRPGIKRPPHKVGDLIGEDYQVREVLGEGGFGVVYLVYSEEHDSLFALKTFLDDYIDDIDTRARFQHEAQIWTTLEYHPNLVRAYFVDEIAGQLFVAMEYVPKNECGWNSLSDYLAFSVPDLETTLRWSIQFCHGMEHSYLKGVRSHRDIKPANILITPDGTIKISDFGISSSQRSNELVPIRSNQNAELANVGLTAQGVCFGTPAYMSPEQFIESSACDQRSDIYSFGIVLYQMIAGGQLPFEGVLSGDVMDYYYSMMVHHHKSQVAPVSSPLFSVVDKCLAKEPENRYGSFAELRKELEPIYFSYTGEYVYPRFENTEINWNLKGMSLDHLGRSNEALECYNKAIEIHAANLGAWVNKGQLLHRLGRSDEALLCYEFAKDTYLKFWKGSQSDLNRQLTKIYSNRGIVLRSLGRDEEALASYEQAIEYDQSNFRAWLNKGAFLMVLKRYDESLVSLDRCLDLNSLCFEAWVNKGSCFEHLDEFDRAISCFEAAVAIHPIHANALFGKGRCLARLQRSEEAMTCFERIIEFSPEYALAWFHKAVIEERINDKRKAAKSYQAFIQLSDDVPRAIFARRRLEILEGPKSTGRRRVGS